MTALYRETGNGQFYCYNSISLVMTHLLTVTIYYVVADTTLSNGCSCTCRCCPADSVCCDDGICCPQSTRCCPGGCCLQDALDDIMLPDWTYSSMTRSKVNNKKIKKLILTLKVARLTFLRSNQRLSSPVNPGPI